MAQKPNFLLVDAGFGRFAQLMRHGGGGGAEQVGGFLKLLVSLENRRQHHIFAENMDIKRNRSFLLPATQRSSLL